MRHPIYSWQKEIYDALTHHKLIAILKARGIGASEYLLRYAMWLCLKDNKMQGKNIAVITGIRENLSIELVNRFRNLLPNFKWESKEGTAEINGCRIIGYPSKRVKDLRGLTDTKLVICDEFAWFDATDQQQVLPVLEVFRTKADAQIVLLSTPASIGDVMYNLYQEPESECRYKRLYMPWQKAVGTLFTLQEIAQAKRQPNFEQEFELRFGSYGIGTIFSMADIDRATKLAQRYSSILPKYPYIERQDYEMYSIGADVGGWGHNKFGIVLIGIFDQKIHVLAAEEHGPYVDEDKMVQRLLQLRSKTPNPQKTRIWIDGSAVSFIRRLKGMIPGEQTDYQAQIDYLKRHKWLEDESKELDLMNNGVSVIPVSFTKHGANMLSNLYVFLSRGEISIHPKFTTLIASLQSAKNAERTTSRNSRFTLDKRSASLDIVDALQLAMFPLDAGVPEIVEEEEEGEIPQQQ